LVKEAIDQFNIVVPAFLPGLKIGIAVNSDESTSGGNTVFELTSIINGYEIPLRSESDGTKRIISICNDLFACYNDDSVVLAVDEFDAGIFEYLFGEIIDVMDQGAQGQMVFTSHNLRPLEVLSSRGLILTTTDPDNRYEFFKGVRATNNARDMYLRNAFLSQPEDRFYKPTNEYEIAKAFMKIGSLYRR
jgi:AAA15 family ATPase/GTPase